VGILEQLGGREVALHFPDWSAMEDIRDAGTWVSGISAICAGMFRDVRYGCVARWLA
jgi:hypothetical protein